MVIIRSMSFWSSSRSSRATCLSSWRCYAGPVGQPASRRGSGRLLRGVAEVRDLLLSARAIITARAVLATWSTSSPC